MASGDGLIVRLRLVGGALTPQQARAIAAAAATFGNGHIDLTSRANLQIRGASERTLPGLQAALDALGLIDADPQAEAVRNIVVSPLAGFDPDALLDIRPSVAALDRRLRADPALWRLPGKFGFVVADGGRLGVAGEPADVAFVAERVCHGEIRFAVRLAGRPAGHCSIADLTDTAARLVLAFIDLRGAGETAARRMSGLVARIEVLPILHAAGLPPVSDQQAPRERELRCAPMLGLQDLGEARALGVGAPFGRLDVQKLAMLADAAESARGELRLTPWRAVLIVGEKVDAALAAKLSVAGFAMDDDDPIRAVAACPGAPACVNASTSTQDDARRLAPLARKLAVQGVALHVSGCSKGCALATAAPVTAVARSGGYDLLLDGRAGDAPALRGVAAEQLDSLFETLAVTPPAERAAALLVFQD